MTTPIHWIAFVAILTAQPHATPKDVLNAYARALETQNYRAIAQLVLGGKPDFDYNNLAKLSPFFESPHNKVRIQVGKIVKVGDSVRVSYDATYAQKGVASYTYRDEAVTMVLDHGDWKIRGRTGPWDNAETIETYAYHFAHPEKTLEHALKYLEPTRNRTLATIKLGMARTRFLTMVFALPDRHATFPPYDGYSQSSLDQYTLTLWPVGVSDELIFVMLYPGQNKGGLFTKWKLVRGKAKRVWQVNVTGAKGSQLIQRGTLANHFHVEQLPAKVPSDLRKDFADSRPYAAYSQDHFGSYWCRVILADGTIRPPLDPQALEVKFNQINNQADARGFFITPQEVAEIEKLNPATPTSRAKASAT